YVLNKDTFSKFPVPEKLGHKLIGVEPDLVIDLTLVIPRIFIRSDLSKSVFGEFSDFLVDAAYINSFGDKSYLSFLCTHAEKFDLIDVSSKNKLPLLFYNDESLYIYEDIVSRIIDSSDIVDIEYRV
ncbi:hypothetical protein CAG64_03910, partial [Vibrio sp. V38_P2S17PM301]|uniref:hypothetical protein n=1 Tax=Vibrio sp. V38_P2S17PM301 TaxID=1938689 RepID=UPI00136126DD